MAAISSQGMKIEFLSLAENLLNFPFHDFFSTGYGFETVKLRGCKLAHFIVLKKTSKIQKKLDQPAVSKLKLF
jgi:hypothetical protein